MSESEPEVEEIDKTMPGSDEVTMEAVEETDE